MSGPAAPIIQWSSHLSYNGSCISRIRHQGTHVILTKRWLSSPCHLPLSSISWVALNGMFPVCLVAELLSYLRSLFFSVIRWVLKHPMSEDNSLFSITHPFICIWSWLTLALCVLTASSQNQSSIMAKTLLTLHIAASPLHRAEPRLR